MSLEIIDTDDGSHTLWLPDLRETYHSKNGAIEEAQHVFIKHGLHAVNQPKVAILEMGFGTGLNAFVTYLEAERCNQKIIYTALELHPLSLEYIKLLNYTDQLNATQLQRATFYAAHSLPWNTDIQLSAGFVLHKRQQDVKTLTDTLRYDLIFYDAFSARVQPELWEQPVFEVMHRALKPNGLLVTYASKASARRAMQQCGFLVEKLPGPTGRREMMRARKPE